MENQNGLKVDPILEIKKIVAEIDKTIHSLQMQADQMKKDYPDVHDKRRGPILTGILEKQQKLQEIMEEAKEAFNVEEKPPPHEEK